MHIKNTMKNFFYNRSHTYIISPKKRIVLVGGCFDILHRGHIEFLEKAGRCGDHLIIALEPNERIIEHKKRNPIHSQDERAYNLSKLRDVDDIILLPLLNGFNDYLNLVKNIKPHVIAITNNDPQLKNKQRQAEEVGAQLIMVTPRIDPFSSSKIYQQHLE